MHKPSSKIHISKEKLTKHFEKHFSERKLELPPELVNPTNFEYLKDSPIVVKEDPPSLEEIKDACKTFKNNKSFGTDNVPPEGLKYSSSNNLFILLTMLISLILINCAVPKSWLEFKLYVFIKQV